MSNLVREGIRETYRNQRLKSECLARKERENNLIKLLGKMVIGSE